MADHRDTDLRDLIEAMAERSEPIALSDVVDHSPVEHQIGPFEPDGSDRSDDGAMPFLELSLEGSMTDTSKRNPSTTWLAAAAAIAVLVIGIALVIRAADNGTDIATDGDHSTTTEEGADVSSANVATGFWEAVVRWR